MTDQLPPPTADGEPDVEGHSMPRAMGMDQLTRPGTPATTGRTRGPEPVEQDLAPLTRRFPRMRDGESRTTPR